MLDTHHLLSAGPSHVHGCWAHVAEPAVGGRGLPRRVLGGLEVRQVTVTWGLIVGAVSLFVFLACRAAGASTVSSALADAHGYLVGVQILTMRPQLVSILLFAVIRWVVVTHQRVGTASLARARLDLRLGEHLHGSFILAFVLLGFAWLEDYAADRAKARRVATVAAVSAIATLANPFGIRVWSYVADVVGNPTVSGRVAEVGPALGAYPDRFRIPLLRARGIRHPRDLETTRASWPTVFALAFFALLGMTAIEKRCGVVDPRLPRPGRPVDPGRPRTTCYTIVAERGVPRGALRPPRHLAPCRQRGGSGFWRTGRPHVRARRSRRGCRGERSCRHTRVHL